jgi:hypothetical protein
MKPKSTYCLHVATKRYVNIAIIFDIDSPRLAGRPKSPEYILLISEGNPGGSSGGEKGPFSSPM